MGSGSPSFPQAITSLASYTRIIRSDVFIRNELYDEGKKTEVIEVPKFVCTQSWIVSFSRASLITYSLRRANSILFTAVALDVPTTILKLASIFNVCEFSTNTLPFAFPV